MKLSGDAPVETGLSANVPNLKSIQTTLLSVHLKEKSWQTQPEKKRKKIKEDSLKMLLVFWFSNYLKSDRL